jgi:hypothetical protein
VGDGALIVQHFRLDPSRKIKGALGIAAGLVTVGALCVAAALMIGRADPRRAALARAPRSTASAPLFRGTPVTASGAPIDVDPSPVELALLAGGILLIVSGGASAIVGLRRVMTEETYLALRTDGALYRAGRERSFVAWDEVEEVTWDGSAVLFVRHDGSAWARSERFADIDGIGLAKCAADVRRKALFGLIR